MPITHGAQVGLPAGLHPVQQAPDHVLAEELNEVRGDAASQVQRGAVFQPTRWQSCGVLSAAAAVVGGAVAAVGTAMVALTV